MKKVKFLQSIAGYNNAGIEFFFRPDDVFEIETDLANAWIASGIAEFTAAPQPENAMSPKARTRAAQKPDFRETIAKFVDAEGPVEVKAEEEG